MMKQRRVILCVDRLDAPNGHVWAARSGGKWVTGHTVITDIKLTTVFRGCHARQPKAYLQGFGVVRVTRRGMITIAKS